MTERGTGFPAVHNRSQSGGPGAGFAGGAVYSGKKRRPRTAPVVILVALLAAGGLACGLYFGLRKDETAAGLLKEGERAFARGDYEEAVRLYLKAIEKDRSSAGYNLLGMAYRFRYGQTADPAIKEKETEAFRKSVELDPDNVVALVNLGVTLYFQNRKEEAAGYLRRALELYPGHPDRAEIEEMIRRAG